jgi:hypothetical protein
MIKFTAAAIGSALTTSWFVMMGWEAQRSAVLTFALCLLSVVEYVFELLGTENRQ